MNPLAPSACKRPTLKLADRTPPPDKDSPTNSLLSFSGHVAKRASFPACRLSAWHTAIRRLRSPSLSSLLDTTHSATVPCAASAIGWGAGRAVDPCADDC